MEENQAKPQPPETEVQPHGLVRLEQTSTRGDGTVELGEVFDRGTIDFSAATGHLSIHTDGEVAGSQFDGEQFRSPEAIVSKVAESLPDSLQYDQHGMAELTLTMEGTRVGFTGVKSLQELEGVEGVTVERGMRMPGGEPAEVDGIRGAWYPEAVRNPETGRFETATNSDGSIKNPHGKFEPEALIAKVSQEAMSVASATDQLTVIIRKDPATGAPTVLTMYPGEVAPAFPAKIQSESFQMDTLQGGPEAAYWAEHAFVKLDSQPEATHKPETSQSVERSLELLQSQDFRDGFIEAQTQAEQETHDQVEAEARSEASKLARAEIEQFAAHQLGMSVEEAKKLGKEWGQAVKAAGGTVSESTGGKTLQEHLFDSHLIAIQTNEGYQTKSKVAEQQLETAKTEAASRVDTLLQELEAAKNDPGFLQAAAAWANAPDKSGDTGQDGQGYNSGIIHFFQYRADVAKSGRFKVMEEPLTVDGFKQFTDKLSADLKAIGSGATENQEAILEDSDGNQRVYILRPDGDLIVAFQAAGETEPRITSLVVRQDAKGFEKNVATTLGGKDKGVLNKLGEQVHRIL